MPSDNQRSANLRNSLFGTTMSGFELNNEGIPPRIRLDSLAEIASTKGYLLEKKMNEDVIKKKDCRK